MSEPVHEIRLCTSILKKSYSSDILGVSLCEWREYCYPKKKQQPAH
jgi:hypothetical protein